MKFGLITICLLMLGSPLSADPGPVGTYLMNKEVSLFSFGLFQLDNNLNDLSEEHAANFSATYDWDANRILLNAYSHGATLPTTENCRLLVEAIRTNGWVSTFTGEPWLSYSRYANFFAPIGFENANAPDDWASRLDQIFLIKISLWRDQADDEPEVRCEGSLLSTDVLVNLKAPEQSAPATN
ncbi:MAG: hypothetical protein ACR2RF_26280 [Geminicoccaceae bacterium]